MEKSKRTIVQALICVGLLCVIWSAYICFLKIDNQKVTEIREDDFSWIAQVDSIEKNGDVFCVKGFALELNKTAKEKAYSIVLRNLDTDELYFPKTTCVPRKDVNAYFLCKYDYTNSGFEFRIKTDKVDFEKNDYEVLVKPSWKEYAYRVGMYLSKGEVVSVDPKERAPLQVSDTKMAEIVKNGMLRAYNSEMGISVYQCDNMMYWFVEQDYPHFGSGGDMWMQFNLFTTQNERLPKEQIEKKCMWNNCSFAFSAKELFATDEYRVVGCEIPQTHSITRVETGHLGEETLWWMKFRPWYDFAGYEK